MSLGPFAWSLPAGWTPPVIQKAGANDLVLVWDSDGSGFQYLRVVKRWEVQEREIYHPEMYGKLEDEEEGEITL